MTLKYKLALILVNITILLIEAENSIDVPPGTNGTHNRVLSRRKRFITFPDGSSFQLVFCAQNQGYLHIGDIVWFGNTAALAWELPTDPIIFRSLKGHEQMYSSQRRQDTKQVIYLDEDGKVISTKPYRRKLIVNPAFAKRSVDNVNPLKTITREKMHETHKHNSYFDELDENSLKFHRAGRKSLYGKLANLVKGLGWRGKDCIHRLICENKNAKPKQGTFIEEIIRLTFTLPKPGSFDLSDEYDEAHEREDCNVFECEMDEKTTI